MIEPGDKVEWDGPRATRRGVVDSKHYGPYQIGAAWRWGWRVYIYTDKGGWSLQPLENIRLIGESK